MGLIQVDTVTLTSSSSTIAVNGIDSDDVYMLACSNLIADSSNAEVKLTVNKSSSAQDDSEYDYITAYKRNISPDSNGKWPKLENNESN